ncbi:MULTISPECIES: ScbA/BarX family gamma-butyrolactone biosynthesis protein [unclassified Streptomyces]|uniref:ScbA/BarX family gamma-butyrolactone biosynthesis protein n=1 Tax=unclassified Streptomyces TaxID=2593676 RepID=UPI0006AFED2A|nr:MULTISPECIES: ScbA/BarX family gamma-butyrolactone biosynthesis protein [unclassified Streptomyces]KOX25607.1 ScbA protein [Streptomyces sp. NRRL F-6491]KOX48951.1 ScbA protein [Streptomyces sp. NRRL F-6492]
MEQHHRGVTAPVPGEFVHRDDPADIIPTGWTRSGDDRYSVSARWPASHPFFSPATGGRHDPVLVAETMRQATMLVVHAGLGVPVDDQFVMWDLYYTADPEALALDGSAPDITADLSFPGHDGRASRVRNLRVDVVLSREGRPLSTGGGTIRCTSAPAYRRMRGERMAALGRPVPLIPPMAPHLVGREDARDVVLGPGDRPGRWQLRINTAHPTLFRRPNDHVPGMLLLEAARQAAMLETGSTDYLPVGMELSFSRYVELDTPCWIEAETVTAPGEPATTVRVTGHQDGDPVFLCTLASPSREPAVAGPCVRLAG